MIVASAPGRCGLVGNPTDMYGGSVLSCATRERALCALNPYVREITLTVSGQSQIIRSAGDLALRDGDYLKYRAGGAPGARSRSLTHRAVPP